MLAPYFTPLKTVLLTGAGFSKPFGGYLASEMWSLILNQPEIRASKRLHQFLLEDLNYEMVYDKILASGDIAPEEKQAFTTALMNAYRHLDDAIRSEIVNHRGQKTMMLNSFLGRFGALGRERGFIFTLNQDLLLERFYTADSGLLQTPAFGHPDWFTQRFRTITPPPDVILPDAAKVASHRAGFWLKGQTGNFVYVKLHGSYGWKSADGTSSMVVGHTKPEAIQKEPLLRWYLDLFKEVIETPSQRLVVVGYGFTDEHINNLLADAVKKGLELHVINPKEPKELRQMLQPVSGFVGPPTPRGKDLWEGLFGYHCASVEELVLPNSTALTARGQSFFQSIGLA